MTNATTRPDVNKVMRGLKDFQRKTVDFVFRRMYTDPDPTRRFLIADEVGLGKTLVARGLIAQAIDHLWDQVERIDVVYICSNGDIARQNVNRLNITDQADFALASRITLLPTEISDLKHNKLNFVSFTPGTSFDLKSSMGMGNERVVLYWLLRRAWGLRGIAPLNVLKGTMGAERFRHRVDEFDESSLDEALAEAFVQNVAAHVRREAEQGQPDLRTRFDELCAVYSRADRNVPYETQRQRSALVGELRALLARTCLRALEPDLIILDEFQRFKHLLQGDDEASMLAQGLFDYSDEHSAARVLLLSATPYKMYTVSHEAEDDHYQDFMKTLRFLTPEAREAQALEGLIAEYRRELFRIGAGETQRLMAVRDQLQAGLRRVMVRTERLAVSHDRDGMLTEVPGDQNKLESQDLEAYLALAAMAEVLEENNPLEYWKSAPYLLNFMDEYEFKESFEAALEDPELASRLAQALAARPGTLLPWASHIRQYAEVDPGNARLRGLLAETIGQGVWQCLWLPPSLPYYQLAGPFANPNLVRFTKRLVFSAWRVVPKVISLLLSYEAERRMIRLLEEAPSNTPADREKRRPLLRFARSEGRLTGLPVLGLIYPSLTLAREGDPLALIGAGGLNDPTAISAEVLLDRIQLRLETLLAEVPVRREAEGAEDERWYWAAPMLLDLWHAPASTRDWFGQDDLAWQWAGRDETESDDKETRWNDHVAQAWQLAREWIAGKQALGPPPADLARVLAQMALGGLGVASLRALARVAGGPAALSNRSVRNSAGQVAWAFLSLFNLPESMALVRGLNRDEPYWRRVLEYCIDGGLQATLDEYAHVLKDGLGLLDSAADDTAAEIAEKACEAITLRTSTPDVDEITLVAGGKKLQIEPHGMRGRFALRFGSERSEEGGEVTRADQVRSAFNSPFWPFVLATTSVGQEGLDFHPYCHAVVHWNLPSNPVDLEQREGRVHRFKGHAVRKNLARQYGLSDITGLMAQQPDPWSVLFSLARTDRAPGASDLVPFWVYPVEGGYTIERHVPAMPLSRDVERLEALRRALAVYRMVFGQSRQEDLLAFLLARFEADEAARLSDTLRIDLAPPSD